MDVSISPRRVLRLLMVIVVALTLASFAGQYAKRFLGHDGSVLTLVYDRFDVNIEPSVPTWYASATILIAAVLLATIARAKFREGDHHALHWAALAVIFLGLSVDEVAMFHDGLLNTAMVNHLMRQDLLLITTPWVIAGIGFTIAVGLAYLGFLRALPTRTRWLFVAAGILFVGGALGLEIVGSLVVKRFGFESLLALVVITAEEFLEMLGIAVFLYALLDYMSTDLGEVVVTMVPAAVRRRSAHERTPEHSSDISPTVTRPEFTHTAGHRIS